MQQRIFGWSGQRLPVIGQGTWQMEKDDRGACITALRHGIELGLTHIDTAELYGDGYVEELIVAQAIAGRRDRVFLASKVIPDHASYEGTLAACEASLRRLGTDHLDLYLLHWRGTQPLARTIAAFERLVDEGKIRFYGVSNFDADDLQELLAIAGPERALCDQVLYHLGQRAAETGVAATCGEQRMALVAYSPLGHGRMPSPRSAEGLLLAQIAEAHAVAPRAVALAFLLRQGTFAIPKTTSTAHVADNAAAADLQLSNDEVARIDAAFPTGPTVEPLPML